MKKLFLFVGVIIWCLHYSCKKDNSPPPYIDSFLLHAPPVLDSLPIPLKIGTWWKYQRIDSMRSSQCLFCVNTVTFNSSTELITVIGKTPIIDTVQETISPWRIRPDTVECFILEVKNLTYGTIDSIHAYYNNASFKIKPNKDNFRLFIYLPIIDGNLHAKANPLAISDTTIVYKNVSLTVLNQNFDNCIYYENNQADYSSYVTFTNYLKPGIGFVDWEYSGGSSSRYGGEAHWSYRRLIDYHIAP